MTSSSMLDAEAILAAHDEAQPSAGLVQATSGLALRTMDRFPITPQTQRPINVFNYDPFHCGVNIGQLTVLFPNFQGTGGYVIVVDRLSGCRVEVADVDAPVDAAQHSGSLLLETPAFRCTLEEPLADVKDRGLAGLLAYAMGNSAICPLSKSLCAVFCPTAPDTLDLVDLRNGERMRVRQMAAHSFHPHLWTELDGLLEVCDLCGDQRPSGLPDDKPATAPAAHSLR